MKFYYLSFSSGAGPIGGAFIRASSDEDAFDIGHRLVSPDEHEGGVEMWLIEADSDDEMQSALQSSLEPGDFNRVMGPREVANRFGAVRVGPEGEEAVH